MTLVSTIIPTFRARPTIDRAIDSVLNQSYRDLEIIVVDDNSDDGTYEYVKERYGAVHQIKAFRLETNSGPSRARNIGIQYSSGDWVAVLDADDAWLPDRIETLLSSASAYDVIADNLIAYDSGASSIVGQVFAREHRGDVTLLDLLSNYGNGFEYGTLKPIFRAQLLKEKEIRYDESLRYGEDLALYIELLCARARFAVLPYRGYVYTTPFGEVSRTLSPHSQTSLNHVELSRSIDSIKSRYENVISDIERAEFSRRVNGIINNASIDKLVDLVRRRRYRAVVRSVLAEPTLTYRCAVRLCSWWRRKSLKQW
jgi:succinoglycan biosynthesis protein ExoO